VEKNTIFLKVGFSHEVSYTPNSPSVTVSSEAPNLISVEGASKELVGRVAADICAIRPTEPYKGKGIKYFGQKVTLKAGKNK
jgi:large subunit ribosomal protein L6